MMNVAPLRFIKILMAFLAVVGILATPVLARFQLTSEGAITKQSLFSALESMQSRKSKRKSSVWYVAMVNEHKVNFQLSPADEEGIRRTGRYLGKKGLDDVVLAIRANYVPKSAPTPSSTTNLTMNNSPGGVQAGRDIVINSGRRLIESLILRISVEIETSTTKTTDKHYDWGLGSVIVLFQKDKTRIRFVTDSKIYDQQVSPTNRRLSFIYTPESPDQIQGQQIEFLESINLLAVNYAEIFRTEKFAVNNEPVILRLAIELNGLAVGQLAAPSPPGKLAAGQVNIDVSELFRQVPKTYNSTVSQTMTNSPGGIQARGNVTINPGVQPRRLSEAQEFQFVQILKDNPKGSVEVTCIESGGPEPCDFARQIARLLESDDAKWVVNFSPIMFGAGDPTKTIPEIYLLVQNNKNPPPRAVVLQYALKTLGYDARGIERPDVAADFVQLTVWFRRP